ncbi:hypothetical protein Q7C36_017821 [Tachysurus vachellii]|uniref:Core-binding (CB) domain-containing protein n=1 Tax=Tachysurus vachellii TaxID=175792 RepID=A0AA88M3Y7_TACVA|nr:hypothetical protein Q7C36_017821 [Tachysurus vachellii]
MDVISDEPERCEEQQQAAVSKSRRQVNTTDGHKCPICGQMYTGITQHLKFTEGVTNRIELDLLGKLAHRRFTANLDCPVRLCNAKHMTRLDKHLQNVHKLEKPVVALYMQKAKDKLITRELALLRASKPTPPMVSHLDEVDDVAIEEGIRREMEASSQAASTEAFFAPCLTIVSSSPDASQTPSEHTNPNMHSISDSGSEAQSEHATLNMLFTSHSVMETPFADSTPNTPPPFHSTSEAHSEHVTLNMSSTSHSVMETPFAQSTLNTHPPFHSASEAHSEHATLNMSSTSHSIMETPFAQSTLNTHPPFHSASEAHSEHATLNMPSTSHSIMETPFAQSTLNTHPPFHSASEAHSEHATLNMPSTSRSAMENAILNMLSTSHSEMETPCADSTQNMHPPSDSSAKAHGEHAILNVFLHLLPTTDSAMETPCAHSTPNMHPPSHSSNEAHATSDMPSHSGSKPNQLARIQVKLSLLRAPGCRNCHYFFDKPKVVTQLLQCEVKGNHEHLHSSANVANLNKYKQRKRFSPSKAPPYVRLVEEFRGHIQGVNPSRKTQENAKQRATHVLHFLEFMADSRIPNVDLLFLENHSRVRNFVAHLQERCFKPTTQRLYLMDVVAFLKYILMVSPQSVRLGTKMINALLVDLRARLRDIRPNVLRHQLSVLRSQSERLVDAKRHHAFIEMAPENIAAMLDDLEKQPENRPILRIFFGFLGGYIVATTGHRKGVVINMTTEQVETAEKTKNGGRIIRAKRQLGHKTYRKVATFMCHDEHTAKRFYEAEDPAEEVQRSRYLSMLAISTCAAKEKKRERRKKGHDEAETVSSSEEEDGLEPVRRKLFQQHKNPADSEEKMERRNDHLRKKNKSVQSKQETPVKSSKPLVSSTEDEGSDEWKPTRDSSEDSEVSDEPVRKEGSHKNESVISPILQRRKQIESSSESDHLEEKGKKPRRRITNVAKKRRAKGLVNSMEDVSGVGKSTPEYPESDSGGEEEQAREMVRKEAENSPVQQKEISTHNWLLFFFSRKGRVAVKVPFGMQHAFVSPGTARILKSQSSKIEAFHQSSVFEVPSPISVLGNIKRQQVGSTSVPMCTSEAEMQKENLEMDGSEGEEGQGREAETSVELFEKEGSDGEEGQEIKAEIQKEPLEMEGTEDQDGQGREAAVQVEPLEEMSGFKSFWSDGLLEGVLKAERSDVKLYLSDSDGEEHQ